MAQKGRRPTEGRDFSPDEITALLVCVLLETLASRMILDPLEPDEMRGFKKRPDLPTLDHRDTRFIFVVGTLFFLCSWFRDGLLLVRCSSAGLFGHKEVQFLGNAAVNVSIQRTSDF